MTGERVARAAEALVGTRFRLHGRDPATGLDCIGLVEAALAAAGVPARLPNHYRLRHLTLPDPGPVATTCRHAPAEGPPMPGDVLILRAGPGQAHLAIVVRDGFVHAHAGLGRVVRESGAPPWPVLHHFRAV